ncbi:MAG: YciI family protein [Streptosporangiales bacterium]|nr:YciI family protein [Streptosporangiales bacterium]
MFILDLTYTNPDRADGVRADHMTWIKQQFDAGAFIASGRKVSGDGGVIIAAGGTRAEVEALAATDPFVTRDVAAYRITEFLATTTAPALEDYRQQAG